MAEPFDDSLPALVGWYQAFTQDQPLGLANGQDIADWLWLAMRLKQAPLSRSYGSRAAKGNASSGSRAEAPASADDDEPASKTPPQDERSLDAKPELPRRQSGSAQDGHLPYFPTPPPDLEQPPEAMARLLSPAALPDAQDLQATLASHSDWRVSHGATPLPLQAPPHFPSPLAILQPVAPLLRRQPSRHLRILDEERSAQCSAELGFAWPVFRPRQEAALRVRLVLDGGVSMAVWQPLAEELQRVLASSQALAQVGLERLPIDALDAAAQREQRPLDPGGSRMLTMLVSDSTGHHWWDGSILPWLQAVAANQCLVVVQTLPLGYWETTALQRGSFVLLDNRYPLGANARYGFTVLPRDNVWEEDEDDGADLPATVEQETLPGILLPLISLNRRDAAQWAAVATAQREQRCLGVLLPSFWRSEPPEPVSVEERLREFQRRASPAARSLLGWMACSPAPLTLGLLRLLQGALHPGGTTAQPLAEVLISQLLQRLPGQGDEVAVDKLQLELLPGLRDILQPQLDPTVRQTVIHLVTQALERHWNRRGSGPSFEALLTDPSLPLPAEAQGLVHFANLSAEMLDQLPGKPCADLAARLRSRQRKLPTWPASMAFEVQEFETAQLVAVPEIETIAFTTARQEEIALHRVAFPTLAPDELPEFLRRVEAEGGAAARQALRWGEAWAFEEPLKAGSATDQLGLTLLEIPAGRFLMGSPESKKSRYVDERPQHPVELESFFISQTPITQAQWREVAGWHELEGESWGRELKPSPSHFQGREGDGQADVRLFEGESNTDQRPVERVSWLDAVEFCSRLNQRTGKTYTLPSEAQWEYACRAGTDTPFSFGETISTELANYNGHYTYVDGAKGDYRRQTTPVGMILADQALRFPANAWGLHDMHGNVREWCLDQWHASYAGAPADGSAWVDEKEANQKVDEESKKDEEHRLLRGGSWFSFPGDCRSATRIHNQPDFAFYSIGFRVVCLPQGPSLNP